jgi:hypothetical protein
MALHIATLCALALDIAPITMTLGALHMTA